ncbi:hypothetical protein QUH73_19710 [Labilibaculum sp. K2S]|uniref:hypothetical protein n=1 Tax=Labilibaculum sp. K2S TaxID=3056386 RepID=UPI0025A44176|nr:hypothetical protein [Labilibaculum sp. K2S]MDM8162054.1 hypothetical protein [Labilibaculum sp. K2S]
MNKNILRHITVEGFAHSSDLSNCELLEKEFNEAKDRFKLAKKEVKTAKKKLNVALDQIITKIENKKKETQNNLDDNSGSSSVFNGENIKSKHEETMVELEVMKDRIKKKIEEYNTKGTENWDSFKHKLNYDLEELGAALKSFVTKSK